MSLTTAHLDALLAAGASAEQIAAVVKADLAEQAAKAEQRRCKDRERQRRKRHAESRTVTRTPQDPIAPPKEYISNPPISVPNGTGKVSGGTAKSLFDIGVALLTAHGENEKQARSLIGKWRKTKCDAEVLAGILECKASAISRPTEWLTKRFEAPLYVSASGFEYCGNDEKVMKEAERRADWNTFWTIKAKLDSKRMQTEKEGKGVSFDGASDPPR